MARKLEINVFSANGLNSTRTCAVGWITTNPRKAIKQTPATHITTHVDTTNGNNPVWNQLMVFTVSEALLQQATTLVLVITINAGSSSPDREIARASVPLMALLNSAGCRSFQLPLSGLYGQPNGNLNISVKTDERSQTDARPAVNPARKGVKVLRVLKFGLAIARLLIGDFGGLSDLFS